MHSAQPACGFALRVQRSILRSTVYVRQNTTVRNQIMNMPRVCRILAQCTLAAQSANPSQPKASPNGSRLGERAPCWAGLCEPAQGCVCIKSVCMNECMYVYVCVYVRTYVRTYLRTYVCMYVCMYVCLYVGRPPAGRPWLHLPQHRAGCGKSQGRAPLKANSPELLPGVLEQSRPPQDQVRELRPQGVEAHQGDAEVCHQAAEATAARHG